ncbi:MAG TPA: ribosomal L7Ae/L30e/S12e/Gadd45 family protein [Syntrophomonadaceae bacterium]|nr:ribosomal L7Ae/L30e/S12e/Gadd45 family protein [Syntrophomonadaceae bacterium]
MKDIYGFLGLACRSGKISSGTMAARSSITSRRANVLIMSNDISPASGEALRALCRRFRVPWMTMGDKYRLGTAVGKAYRVAVTVNDKGMAETILKVLNEAEEAKSMGVDEWQK